MKKMLFIFNPKSGRLQIKNHLMEILDTFVKAGYRVDVYPTQCHQDAKNQAMNYGGDKDIIVCAGGDGTLNEVISGVMQAGIDVPIGYIPAGSTNDFATSLKIPKNVKKAAFNIVYGVDRQIDIGRFNGSEYFNYVAAIGAFTDVSYATSQDLKNVLGHQAYILEGVKRLSTITPYNIVIEADTLKEPIRGKFLFGMITNSHSVAGLKMFNQKEVDLSDGQFEVTFIRELKSALEIQNVGSFFTGEGIKSDFITHFKASDLKVICEDKVPWVLDGEYGGTCKIASIENINRAINIKAPENK